MRRARAGSGHRPDQPDEPGWRLKFRGIRHDDILTRTFKTGYEWRGGIHLHARTRWLLPRGDGRAKMKLQAKHRVANPIRETTVWDCFRQTTELGYRYQGVQIIADKDVPRRQWRPSWRSSADQRPLRVVHRRGRRDLYHYRLIASREGTVKLIDCSSEEACANIFLNASTVSDRQMFVDSRTNRRSNHEEFLDRGREAGSRPIPTGGGR